MSKLTFLRALPAAVAALALGAGAAHAQRYTLRDDRVAIYNLAGEVRVEPGTGSAVVVEVTRGGSDRERLRVDEGARDGYQTLSVVYPGDRVVYPRLGRGSRSTLTIRGDGTFGGGITGGRRVTVVGTGRGLQAYADLRVTVPAGRTIAINQGVGRVAVTNVNGQIVVRTSAASVTATGTRGNLNVDVGSGGVTVRDAEGEITLDTGSGGVTVNRIRGPRLVIDTGSGGVHGGDLRVEQLHVDVGSGGVDLQGVAARDVLIDTGSGSVDVELTRDVRSVRIDSGSGGVELGVPEGLGAELEIETGSGGIDVDVPVVARRSGRSHLTGRIGDGDGRIEIDTGSG
ncbi:MAG TPA: DUF4097 family beta strand repeat-containing protein, partial [Longimicrobiaceae bacterium]|nr:DUF4097 family beta strand repeat-containing protein [Longimicrobiaceae bacterium]